MCITLDTQRQMQEYWYVNLGPISGMPGWHVQSKPTRYPFPTVGAATAFARGHKTSDRHVDIEYPDGRRWDGAGWMAPT